MGLPKSLLGIAVLVILAVAAARAGPPAAAGEMRYAQAVPLGNAPAAPGAKPFFSTDFGGRDLSGADLSRDWEVENPDPDGYLLEDHALLIVASSFGGLDKEKSRNIFRLRSPLPDADWVVTLRLKAEFQTFKEAFAFGLYDDQKNFLAASLYSSHDCCSGYLTLQLVKVVGGQMTEMHVPAFKKEGPGTIVLDEPASLRLQRSGHGFRASVSFAGQADAAGNPVWQQTPTLTVVRPPRSFVMLGSQWEQNSGETAFRVVAVTIEAPPR
jgi:hypothetical protein